MLFRSVVLEAALAGRPVVVSDDPGMVGLIEKGTFGIVVPRGDAAALAEALRKLLDSPAECDRMGAEARVAALEAWTADVGIPRTREVYSQACLLARARLADEGKRT